MTSKIVVTALGAMIAAGINSQAGASSTPEINSVAYKKICTGDQNGENSVNAAWWGLPTGTCEHIFSLSNSESAAS